MLVIGGPGRMTLGLVLLAVAGALVATTHRLEFGIGWTAVIPALVLMVPGTALLQRRVLTLANGRLTLTEGWWWRRAWTLPLTGATLERIPTAGCSAVVLHTATTRLTLATWVTGRTVDAIAALTGLPPITAAPPTADR